MSNLDDLRRISGHSTSLEKDRLPPFVVKTVDGYLALKNPGSDYGYLVLCSLSLASWLLCFQRVRITRVKGDTTPPNMYVVAFLPSSSYKDKPFSDMRRNIMDFVNEEIDRLDESNKKREFDRRLEEGDVKFGKPEKGGHKNAAFAYAKENAPRSLTGFFRSGTTAPGLISLRAAFKTAGKGSPFLLISEFANLLKAKSGNDFVMLDLIQQLFDYGNNDPVILKTEKHSEAISDIPQTAWMHSSFDGVLEDKEVYRDLLVSLNRQMARRSFFFFPPESSAKRQNEDVTDDELVAKMENEDTALRNAAGIRGLWKSVFDILYADPVSSSGDAELRFSFEANRLYMLYQMWNDKRASGLDDSLSAEMRGRHYKAMKMAGIVGGIENPKEGITLRNMEQAIYLTEFFGDHFKRLALKRVDTFSEEVIRHLSEMGITGSMTTEISTKRFCADNYFSAMFRSSLPTIREICELEGKAYFSLKEGRNGIRHYIIPVPKDAPADFKLISEVYENGGDCTVKSLVETYGREPVIKSLAIINS